MFGLAATVPAVVALPLGVWLVRLAGFPAVFAVAAAAAVLAAPLVPGCRPRRPRTVRLALPADVLRPAVVFFATAVAGGVVVAFLPGAVAGGVAAPALLAQAAAATLTRWLAGRHADRHSDGMVALGCSAPRRAGRRGRDGHRRRHRQRDRRARRMALFGTGFGLAQAASLTTMLQRVPPTGTARSAQPGTPRTTWAGASEPSASAWWWRASAPRPASRHRARSPSPPCR